MMSRTLLVLASLCALLGPGSRWVMAQDTRTLDIRLPPGSTGTSVRGRIVGSESVLYRLGAEAGQTLTVSLQASNGATYFNVYAPGKGPGDEALANSGMDGPLVPEMNRFKGELPQSGVYTISVYMMRSAARRNETSRYTLRVDIPAKAGALDKPVQNDFADGLAGGPDYWQVAGVAADDKLNIRSSPSAASPILARVGNGVGLRNLGCRMAEGSRWCRVETLGDVHVAGWTAGRFLVEGSGPAPARP